MEKLTQEDIKNIIALISVAPIKGQEATTVAILQQKLLSLLTPTKDEASKQQDTTKSNKSGK